MKRVLIVFLAVVIMFSASSCGQLESVELPDTLPAFNRARLIDTSWDINVASYEILGTFIHITDTIGREYLVDKSLCALFYIPPGVTAKN